jgi:hypothetical protein
MRKEKQTEAENCVCITSGCLKIGCKSRCNAREYCPEVKGKRLAEILHNKDKKVNILISDLDKKELYEGNVRGLLLHFRYNPYAHLNEVYVSSMCVSNNTIHITVGDIK